MFRLSSTSSNLNDLFLLDVGLCVSSCILALKSSLLFKIFQIAVVCTLNVWPNFVKFALAPTFSSSLAIFMINCLSDRLKYCHFFDFLVMKVLVVHNKNYL